MPDGAVGGEWFAETEELRRYIEGHGILLGQMVEPLTAASVITQLFTAALS